MQHSPPRIHIRRTDHLPANQLAVRIQQHGQDDVVIAVDANSISEDAAEALNQLLRWRPPAGDRQ